MSRREQIEKMGQVPVMPQFGPAGYLVDYLFEFGPVKADAPLDAEGILAMQKVLGVKFKPWEARLLARLSREYKGGQHDAMKPDAPPPWPDAAPQWRQVQQRQAARNLDAFLR